MYPLFEIKKVLSFSKPGGGYGVNIELSAYYESNEQNILVLVCDNSYLVLRFYNANNASPVIKQVRWFHSPEKHVKALCFDPTGKWLLLVTLDASIYILPVLSCLETSTKDPNYWRTDNITEIKLSGQRALLTSIRWWQTLQGQHIAIIGSELGEIAFVNLLNKKEVGGTYITIGITSLDILNDESHDTTYLLITGNNKQQWRLLLEEKKSNFYWPFNLELEVIDYDGGKSIQIDEKILSAHEKDSDQRPHQLSKFERGTFLTPQSGSGRNLVSAYNASTCLLQVLEGDLDQMHLFSYKLPPNCENIILSDKLIFVTQNNQPNCDTGPYSLKILSRKFAEVCSENAKKKEHHNSEIQNFILDGKILAVYKKVVPKTTEKSLVQLSTIHNAVTQVKKLHFNNSENTDASEPHVIEDANKYMKTHLDMCYIVQRNTVWECKQRIHPETLFLSFTSVPSDLPHAEKLGVMLGLDIHKLYEVAADMQLARGQFAQAVHLYQLSKCPQLKRIAHFMSYGYLSELVAYIQVLFSTKGVEIVPADKCHFANIALHCFAQQTMEKIQERSAITVAFKRFLRDNLYYDEEVAVKLLTEQGLYDLLYYFAEVRGQHGLMIETLMFTGSIKESLEDATYNDLLKYNYEDIIFHSSYDEYMLCITSFSLLQFLAAKPNLLNQHLQHLITLLPKMHYFTLLRVASLYDPSRSIAKLALHNIAFTKRQRYWSSGSIASISSEAFECCNYDKTIIHEEDVIKFFIFVLLMICHKLNKRHFDKQLILCDVPLKQDSSMSSTHEFFSRSNGREIFQFCFTPLSCGLAHAAYIHNGILYTWGKTGNGRLGNGNIISDYQTPLPVNTLVKLHVKVLSVSCGASHTLALTDCGVFSWGSSRYGQLGAGDIQRACQPIVIETLLNEDIIAVQCGQYHSLALTKCGEVYSWGWGIHGQLGHGNPEDLCFPKKINYLKMKTVIALDAGQGHSIALTRNGEIYTFGCGMFGQLGTGSVSKQSLPQLVCLPEPIVAMASGYFHIVAVGKTNKVYTWGCNPQTLRLQAQCSRRARQHLNSQGVNVPSQSNHNFCYSQNGKSVSRSAQNQQMHLAPSVVDTSAITTAIKQVSCGSHHTVVVTANGEIYSWGRNTEGQVGNGTRKEQKTAARVLHLHDYKIAHAACGADFTIAMDINGKIFGWGQNDGAQIGRKPSEPSVKPASNSTNSRVITIRTNRRMVTITQPCRQSLLKPVAINIPYNEVQLGDLDSESFDSEHSITRLHQGSVWNRYMHHTYKLSTLDNPSYGPYALHTALKIFHSLCDSVILLEHCLSFKDYQAAAKVCALENLYPQALEYQLKAITVDSSIPCKDYLLTALDVIKFYTSMVESESVEKNQKFLNCVIKFWLEYSLEIQSLEIFLQSHLELFSYPFSLLLFSNEVDATEKEMRQTFLSLLSTSFCLSITKSVISQMHRNKHQLELVEEMIAFSSTASTWHQINTSDSLTAWNDSVPSERWWQEILHNAQKSVLSHSSLHLTSNDIDILVKSLTAEKLCCHQSSTQTNTKTCQSTSNAKDVIVFSCGHHYTMQAFRTSVLPGFQESIKKMSVHIPQTLKLLSSNYHSEGIIPAACPRCVLVEIKNEC